MALLLIWRIARCLITSLSGVTSYGRQSLDDRLPSLCAASPGDEALDCLSRMV